MSAAAAKGTEKRSPHMWTRSNRIKKRKVRKGYAAESRVASIPANKETVPNPFLRSWVWKREPRSDKERFDLPYKHSVNFNGRARVLDIQQARFKEEGFASTVWDSSIVLAKYFEKRPDLVRGKRCLELGAGCGLVGIVMAVLEAATVTLTDMAGNLPLLEKNKQLLEEDCKKRITIKELMWGSDVRIFGPPLDVIVATDVVYNHDVVQPLIDSIRALSGPHTQVYFAYGRNRTAEESFFNIAHKDYASQALTMPDLDAVYHCDDVDVYTLRLQTPQVS